MINGVFDVENLTGSRLVFLHIVVLMTTLNHHFPKENLTDLQFNDP